MEPRHAVETSRRTVIAAADDASVPTLGLSSLTCISSDLPSHFTRAPAIPRFTMFCLLLRFAVVFYDGSWSQNGHQSDKFPDSGRRLDSLAGRSSTMFTVSNDLPGFISFTLYATSYSGLVPCFLVTERSSDAPVYRATCPTQVTHFISLEVFCDVYRSSIVLRLFYSDPLPRLRRWQNGHRVSLGTS